MPTHGQIVESLANVRVVGTERLLPDRQGALVQTANTTPPMSNPTVLGFAVCARLPLFRGPRSAHLSISSALVRPRNSSRRIFPLLVRWSELCVMAEAANVEISGERDARAGRPSEPMVAGPPGMHKGALKSQHEAAPSAAKPGAEGTEAQGRAVVLFRNNGA